MKLPVPVSSREQQVERYAAKLAAAYPTPAANGETISEAYIAYMTAHPAASPVVIYGKTVAEIKAFERVPGNLGKDVAAGITGSGVLAQDSAIGVATLPDPLSGIDAIGHFFSSLEDASLWRSIGWLLLGVALIILGIALWLKKVGYLPDVIPLPA